MNEHTKGSVTVTKDRKLIMALPRTLDFENNYEATVSHFQCLSQATQSASRVRTLLFNNIKNVSPSAALVLASEVDRWNQRSGRRLRADTDSWDKEIEKLLYQMGYFELLGIPHPTKLSESRDLTFLHFKRGYLGDKDAGKLAKELRVEIEAIVGSGIKKHFLFEGLSEAITNVCQHAYPQHAGVGIKQWWLSASYNKRLRELCVMIYDQGVGIPGTLPRWKFYELVKDVFNSWTDSQKIEAAMEIGRTSSGLTERGKGLQNLIKFARSHREGRLSIYSLNGMYRMISKQDGASSTTTTTLRRDHENSIGGTLIEWSVKL